jgi:predicted nucleic acid-binding protein
MNKKKIGIIDATILLDFITGDIFDTLFSVPIDFHTSDFVADEVSKTYSFEDLEGFGLQVLEMSEEQMLEIENLQGQHPELSPGDLSVYILARNLDAILISGDGPLREMAEMQKIEYHGTLWLLEELVKCDLISTIDAASGLETMLKRNRWLPRQECEKLIKKWRSGH